MFVSVAVRFYWHLFVSYCQRNQCACSVPGDKFELRIFPKVEF